MQRSLNRALRAIALAVLPLALIGCGVNTIPTKEEKAKASFADVQTQYQRRADLIPNLVSTVQAYAQQERAVLVEVTQARASATRVQVNAETLTNPAQFQQFQQSQDRLSGVLGRLMMISERYPDLKSNTNFLALQSQLEGTENRIAIARRDYNESVRDYNTTLRTFPSILWAKTFYSGSKPMLLFTAGDSAQAAPSVNFNIAPSPGAAAPAPAPVPAAPLVAPAPAQ